MKITVTVELEVLDEQAAKKNLPVLKSRIAGVVTEEVADVCSGCYDPVPFGLNGVNVSSS